MIERLRDGRGVRVEVTTGVGLLAAALLLLPTPAQGQDPPDEDDLPPEVVEALEEAPTAGPDEDGIITVPSRNSEVVTHSVELERVLITDPDVADVVTVTTSEVVLNGKEPGTTTLLFWDENGGRYSYTVRVTADYRTIQYEFDRMFPNDGLRAMAVGNTLVLSGETADPEVAERAVALAESLSGEAEIHDYISVPDRGQIMLHVRVAEVDRSAMRDLGAHLQMVDPFNIRGADEIMLAPGGVVSPSGDFLGMGGPERAFSDAVNLFFYHQSSNIGAFIEALEDRGQFQSLAEPNLLTLPGEEASFLAGGEFPYPVAQPGQAGQATIQFHEFGIQLDFTPEITNAGAVRMHVAPEVSQLDFAGGLEVQGFQVPSILSRRAETTVEVQDGQTFAIAGLMDDQLTETERRIPLLGDIPVLGRLFRSEGFRQERTELLVLVTPEIVHQDMEVPDLPGGEPADWDWIDFMRWDHERDEEEGGSP